MRRTILSVCGTVFEIGKDKKVFSAYYYQKYYYNIFIFRYIIQMALDNVFLWIIWVIKIFR